MEKNIDKDMKILVAAFAFNEKPYLPAWAKYYRSQGCDLLVLDNYSTDGTYEWCQENGIHTGRVDTRDAFNLLILQKALTDEIRKIKPDWVIYVGIDLYQIFPNGIRGVIKEAEEQGCNIVEVDHYEAFNTGEENHTPLTSNYFYVRKHGRLRMMGKMTDGFRLLADDMTISNPVVFQSKGILINYGMCKPREEREVTYKRRQKAWERGMHQGWGTHYKPAQSVNWIWDKNTLRDIRTLSEVYELIKQTQ